VDRAPSEHVTECSELQITNRNVTLPGALFPNLTDFMPEMMTFQQNIGRFSKRLQLTAPLEGQFEQSTLASYFRIPMALWACLVDGP